MSNAAFREMNRRQYIQWAFEISAAAAVLIWWKWPSIIFWWTPQQSIEARAIALARIAALFLPGPMLDRASIAVDPVGRTAPATAILSTVSAPGFYSLRLDSWIYLCTPPAIGLLAAIGILYLAHRLRSRAARKHKHVRGAEIDDQT